MSKTKSPRSRQAKAKRCAFDEQYSTDYFCEAALKTMVVPPANKRANLIYDEHRVLFGAYDDGTTPIYLEPTSNPAPLVWSKTSRGFMACHGLKAGPRELWDNGPRDPATWELVQRLLSIAGTWVDFYDDDSWHSASFAAYSELLRPVRVLQRKGRPRECHANSLRQWDKYQGKHSLMTGYALSKGCWYRHSWLTSDKGVLFETTVTWDKYLGVTLGPAQTWQWYTDWFGRSPKIITRDRVRRMEARQRTDWASAAA